MAGGGYVSSHLSSQMNARKLRERREKKKEIRKKDGQHLEIQVSRDRHITANCTLVDTIHGL